MNPGRLAKLRNRVKSRWVRLIPLSERLIGLFSQIKDRLGPRSAGLGLAILVAVILWWNCLPETMFVDPYSTVVKSREGELLGARIADDGQWRFPASDGLPKRYTAAVLLFEDEYFYSHPGFNPFSIAKALWHNITRPSRRGGSTISQQVVRLSRRNRARTYGEKLIELIWATRLEWRYSKDEILSLYAAHTPYGGNVVGLEAASWRYFGLSPEQLSWAQIATLAVLPNAPSLIFPGRNQGALKAKRDHLLRKLARHGHLDSLGLELALEEPLPGKPLPLPDPSPHLTEWVRAMQSNGRGQGTVDGTPLEPAGIPMRMKQVRTTLDAGLQRRVNRWVENRYRSLASQGIHNMAVLVLDVKTREVLAYVGNAPAGDLHSPAVDMVRSPRSTGSALKPLLFAAALEEGQLLPESLVADIPTVYSGYRPENFDRTFRGAAPAGEALASSLNVPAVRILRAYGLEKFYRSLRRIDLRPAFGPEHYGLAFILGGAELSLWELTATYAALSDRLTTFTETGSYATRPFRSPELFLPGTAEAEKNRPGKEGAKPAGGVGDNGQREPYENPLSAEMRSDPWSAGPLYLTFEALRMANRPGDEQQWEFFREAQPVAWKTGTSFGFKDAWAIGVTPRYAIGVWVGNADGEGRAGLTGIQAAAPLFFDILSELPPSGWFEAPERDLASARVCTDSGWLAGSLCTDYTLASIPTKGLRSEPCRYHEVVFLDREGRQRVSADCYPAEDMQSRNYFQLPGAMSFYYARTRNDYRRIPPWKEGCQQMNAPVMDFIFPQAGEDVLIPVDFGGERGDVVFALAHQNPETQVYWYLDDLYLGSSETFHEWAFSPEPGEYTLTVVDGQGNRLQRAVTFRMASETSQ